jgi:transcriptional regulator with XRE-family HTH domain
VDVTAGDGETRRVERVKYLGTRSEMGKRDAEKLRDRFLADTVNPPEVVLPPKATERRPPGARPVASPAPSSPVARLPLPADHGADESPRAIIKRWLKLNGRSQRAAADALGVDSLTLSALRHGRALKTHRCTHERLEALARIIGCRPEQLDRDYLQPWWTAVLHSRHFRKGVMEIEILQYAPGLMQLKAAVIGRTSTDRPFFAVIGDLSDYAPGKKVLYRECFPDRYDGEPKRPVRPRPHWAQELRKLRTSGPGRKRSQQDIANQLGLSLSAVKKHEDGKLKPRIAIRVKYEELYGVTAESFSWDNDRIVQEKRS